jgi:hypothetical protein
LDTEDVLEVTAVTEAPPELKVARSDVRELRVSHPTPPRPAGVPRPNEAVVKASHPPLPAAVAPAIPDVGSKMPTATPAPAETSITAPATRPEAASELELSAALMPRPFVLARTAWFFGVFVAIGAFRWTVDRFSHGRAWLVAEWTRAASRAKAPR